VALWDNEPFVPVTATLVTPSEAKLHDSEEFPEPVTLVGEISHDVLFVDRLTRPVKPFSALTERVEEAEVPTLTVMLVGRAATLKSLKRNIAVVEWVSEPLVPVSASV